MRDYRLALMAGIDIPIDELAVVAHPPAIKEIAYMGEAEFFTAAQYLCLEKEQLIQDKTVSSTLTNFQVLMKVLDQSKEKDKKKAVQMLLRILFPSYKVAMTKNSIILNQEEQKQSILIDQDNFDTFQQAIRQILCMNNVLQGSNVIYNPANERAKQIAEKLMKGRQRVAALKQGQGNDSALTRYISILTVGLHWSIEDCVNMNLFQLFDQMERYNAKIEWETDLQVRLAGGKPDKTVESWMKELHPNN